MTLINRLRLALALGLAALVLGMLLLVSVMGDAEAASTSYHAAAETRAGWSVVGAEIARQAAIA